MPARKFRSNSRLGTGIEGHGWKNPPPPVQETLYKRLCSRDPDFVSQGVARDGHGGVLGQLFAMIGIATSFEDDAAAVDLYSQIPHAAGCPSANCTFNRSGQSFGVRKGFGERIVADIVSLRYLG